MMVQLGFHLLVFAAQGAVVWEAVQCVHRCQIPLAEAVWLHKAHRQTQSIDQRS